MHIRSTLWPVVAGFGALYRRSLLGRQPGHVRHRLLTGTHRFVDVGRADDQLVTEWTQQLEPARRR